MLFSFEDIIDNHYHLVKVKMPILLIGFVVSSVIFNRSVVVLWIN